MAKIRTDTQHPSVQALARYFEYSHLPDHLQGFSQQCYDLAANMIADLEGPELTAGLRKLLEAKDCFIRAALDYPENRASWSDR